MNIEFSSKEVLCLSPHEVEIHIATSQNRELTIEEKRVISKAGNEIFNLILKTTYFLSIEVQDEIIKKKQDLLTCFNETIFVEEIPNEYFPDAFGVPWFMVTTKIGHFKIGRRNRVIMIDWSKTINNNHADVLFQGEDTWIENRTIHAWSCEKAKQYIAKIIATANEKVC